MVSFNIADLDRRIGKQSQALKRMFRVDRHHATLPLRHLRVIRKWVTTFGGLPNLYSDFHESIRSLGMADCGAWKEELGFPMEIKVEEIAL